MQKLLFIVLCLLMVGGGAWYVYQQNTAAPVGVACTMEARLCPDGVTYVGRQGPACEFAACPTGGEPAKIPTKTAKLNQKIELSGVQLIPLEVIEDSRCPTDVQCIQAGRVRVQALLTTGQGEQNPVLVQGESFSNQYVTITLTDVTPAPRSGKEIAPNQYLFTFTIVVK